LNFLSGENHLLMVGRWQLVAPLTCKSQPANKNGSLQEDMFSQLQAEQKPLFMQLLPKYLEAAAGCSRLPAPQTPPQHTTHTRPGLGLTHRHKNTDKTPSG
jgi:hypothetical protein